MAVIIKTEFVDSIEDLNSMIQSENFNITSESIINIQWNSEIKMYCVYWKDNGGKGFTYEDGFRDGYSKGERDTLRRHLIIPR